MVVHTGLIENPKNVLDRDKAPSSPYINERMYPGG